MTAQIIRGDARSLPLADESVDLVVTSPPYCRLATWRCNDPGERARAMQVEKSPAVMDGQLDLFEALA